MKKSKTRTLDALLKNEEWSEARALIERELEQTPDDHWLLTQRGVTLYEQQRYQESLAPLTASLKIVPDCPLTLWNIAGALDALDRPKIALQIYTQLLQSKKTSEDDPCWESESWADSLKADCVYRIGVCFERLKRWKSAEHCFQQYIELNLAGISGIYLIEDAARHIRELRQGKNRSHGKDLRKAIDSTLQDEGMQTFRADQLPLLGLTPAELLTH